MSEGWYEVPFTAPLGRTREYVDVVRAVLANQTVQYHGEHFRIPSDESGVWVSASRGHRRDWRETVVLNGFTPMDRSPHLRQTTANTPLRWH